MRDLGVLRDFLKFISCKNKQTNKEHFTEIDSFPLFDYSAQRKEPGSVLLTLFQKNSDIGFLSPTMSVSVKRPKTINISKSYCWSSLSDFDI